VVVLVIAADEGLMPQTIEAIDHAQAAEVPIVVAINKIDKKEANSERVKKQLSERNLTPEEWGGKTICVEVSAKEKRGLDHLLEMLLLEAEMLELRANPQDKAKGTVIEAGLDRGKGPVATVLVREGTLRIGDALITGLYSGKVRAMTNDRGERVREAGPSIPVEISGLSGVAQAGDKFEVVENENEARRIVAERKEMTRTEGLGTHHISLEELHSLIEKGEVKELRIVLKADVQGSLEALKNSLERLSSEKVGLRIIHGAVGGITETDIMLASASDALVLGFNVKPDANAQKVAKYEEVDLRTYRVIYETISDIQKALEGLWEPEIREVILGKAEVRKLFKVSKVGKIAGSYVSEGKIVQNAKARVLREGERIYEGKISSLKRFQEDVREAQSGLECGISLENFKDIQEGDIVEIYTTEIVK
jgi:translation initiation factor IF-2